MLIKGFPMQLIIYMSMYIEIHVHVENQFILSVLVTSLKIFLISWMIKNFYKGIDFYSYR